MGLQHPATSAGVGPSSNQCGCLSLEQTKLWARTLLTMCITGLFHKVNAEHYRPITFAFIGISLMVHFCADRRRINQLWWSALLFMVLLDVMYLQMAYTKEAVGLHLYMDLPTQLTTTLPGLLLLNLGGVPLSFLFVCNAGSSAAFYYTVTEHCVPLAILRAMTIQAVCYYAFLRIKRSTSCACKSWRRNIDPSHGTPAPESSLGLKHSQQQAQEAPPGSVAPGRSTARMSRDAAAVNEAVDSNKSGMAASRASSNLGTAELLLSAQKHELQQQQQPQPLQQGACMKHRVIGLKQHAESLERSSSSRGGSSYRSSLPQNLLQQARGLQQAQSSSKISVADVQKLLTEGARARAHGPRQLYVSKLARTHCLHSSSTMEYLQEACRFAIKMNGSSLPEHLSPSAAAHLRHRLSRCQRLMPAEPAAVRAGCLVISFSACPFELPECVSMQVMREEVAAIASEWAQEHGLLADGRELLSTQACKQVTWGSSSSACREATSPEFSMGLRMPFLLPDLPCPTPVPANLQEQQVCAEAQPSLIAIDQSEMSCCFEMVLVAPPHFEVRGWRGAADAPEDLPYDIKNCSVCLLASLGGHFVSVAVEQRSSSNIGERVLQVRVGLPVSMLSASTHCPGVLVLELWAAGSLVCSHSALLLSSCYSGAFAELQDWSASQANSCQGQAVQDQAAHCHLPVESTAFMEDLVCWMYFQASTNSAQQQQQHLHNESAAARSNIADKAVEELALMADVGQDLLRHCMECGMVAVAGLLAEGLVSSPFWLPLPTLLGSQLSEVRQADYPPSDYQGEAADAVTLDSTSQQAHPEAGPSTAPKAQAAASSLWAEAARGCVKGFGTQAAGRACSTSTNQEQHATEPAHPTEAGFKEWEASLAASLTTVRFCCSAIIAVSAPFEAFLKAGQISTVTLLTLNALPYIVGYRQPKVALSVAKYFHFLLWALMGIGVYAPMNRRTRNMVDWNVEVLVLVFFVSPVPEQGRLPVLLRERTLTTAALALLFNALKTWQPLLRSLLTNLAALSIEVAISTYLRWLYLKHVKGQQCEHQLQNRKTM